MSHHVPVRKQGTLSLAIGSVGIVYGDIGTSPLYAFRESLKAAADGGALQAAAVIGILSLMLWTLALVVTMKYVLLVMRADNRGEGGILSLMTLAHNASDGRRPRRVARLLTLGMCGAALFYGDAIITPAISVLSALEGLELVGSGFTHYILPLGALILIALFWFQSRGTTKVAKFFGPIMVLWFALLAAGGLAHILDTPQVWGALNPWRGMDFLLHHGVVSFVTMGAVFLTVTGAEALYADMGHFGKRPIRMAWLWFVMPSLMLNYLGQGALVLSHPETAESPFYLLYPEWATLPMVIMAGLATVIASQAVISGAFSLTHQAVQLGMLPRLRVNYTSEHSEGQIYLPAINWILLACVLLLMMVFRTSANLAAAYGIAVTGTMIITTLLLAVVMRRAWRWKRMAVFAVIGPLLTLDVVFLGANLLKVHEGGYVPLVISGFLVLCMRTWVRGCRMLHDQTHHRMPVDLFFDEMRNRPLQRVEGTAVYLTSNTSYVPSALLQNAKHNKVIHTRNVILTLEFVRTPYVADEERLTIELMEMGFSRVIMRFGYMENPNVVNGIKLLRGRGMTLDMMSTTFFISRRSIVPSATFGMPLWRDRIFIGMARSASDAADYFHIPSSRIVELGMQMTV